MKLKRLSVVILFLFLLNHCGYHRHPIKVLPSAEKEPKTLFIAFDGIAYNMMNELKKEGHYKSFQPPIPLVVTFPSATTVGFTGIFRPLDCGKVPGYETRFYSYADNKVIGGTPGQIYKIPINYKTYFDSFRHTMTEKGVMYTFPGVAGKQDLMRTERLVLESDKNILMTYLGGTDGAQHLLGRKRTKRFMIYTDHFLERMKKHYYKTHGQPLRIVLFSDHGFHFDQMKMIFPAHLAKVLKAQGFHAAPSLQNPKDVVLVQFGLLSAGVIMTHSPEREKIAQAIKDVEGIDLVFWPEGSNRIMILNHEGQLAYFEYKGSQNYRYVTLNGDPLKYGQALTQGGFHTNQWLTDDQWAKLTWNLDYPDAGYRLYDSFNNLVENKASLLFSTYPPYQYGGMAAFMGTQLKPGGHKGTHGGLFRETSWGVVMTDDPHVQLPVFLRYDDFFKFFLPQVSQTMGSQILKEIQVLTHPQSEVH